MLPPQLKPGELYLCTSSNRMYIGTAVGNVLVNFEYKDIDEVTKAFPNNSIRGEKLLDYSVDSIKLKDATFTEPEIDRLVVNNTIDNKKLKDNTIQGNKIAESTIESYHLKDGIIYKRHLTPKCIDSTMIDDKSIKANHLDDFCISGTSNNIEAGNEDSFKIRNAGTQLGYKTVGTDNLADYSINSNKLADGVLKANHLSNTLKSDVCVAVEYYGPKRSEEERQAWVKTVKEELCKTYGGVVASWNSHELLFPEPQKDSNINYYREVRIFYKLGVWNNSGKRMNQELGV